MPVSARSRARTVAALLALAVIVPTAPATLAASPGSRPADGGRAWDQPVDFAPVRLVARMRPAADSADARRLEDAVTTLVDFDAEAGTAVYSVRTGGLGTGRRRLAADSAVASVTESRILQRHVDPTSEPYWPWMWGLHNTGQTILELDGEPDVDADGLESLALTTGSGAVVAVIDDGVDFSQPDLAGSAWVNPGESGDNKETNGLDDDANGYIDDVHGWDFCHDDNTVHDANDDYHGTHVAGTIAARRNGSGMVGVAPDVRIMALKFLGNDTDVNGDPLCGWDHQAVEAIEYAASFDVQVSNNSWGRRAVRNNPADGATLKAAIAASGMLFVASAGNTGIDNDTDPNPAIPASFDLPNVLTVAAIDNTGFLADFSNYGSTSVDLAAPGVAILSTVPAYDDGENAWDAGHVFFDGTSMASPHVSGIAAIVVAEASSPMSPTALKARILNSAKAKGITTGATATGRIASGFRALDGVAPTSPAPGTYTFLTGTTVGSTIATRVRWPAGTDDLSGVGSYALRQSINGGAWSTITAATPSLYADRSLTIDTRYRFRVRAQDRAGNAGGYVDGAEVMPRLRQQTSSVATYGGTWTTSSSSTASGGSTRYATRAGAWVTFAFTGRAIAVVAPRSSSRGSVKVYIDDVYVGTVSAYRSSGQSRAVLYAKSWSSSGNHTIKLVVVGTAGRPRFDIDAFASMN